MIFLDENRRYEGEVEIMSISMIGIDHNMAPVDIRAHFAFTKKNAGEAMEKIKNHKGIYGCVILSTCNRLEVWASVDDDEEVCLYDCLCQEKVAQSKILAAQNGIPLRVRKYSP